MQRLLDFENSRLESEVIGHPIVDAQGCGNPQILRARNVHLKC